MPFSGVVHPEQLSLLTSVLDEYCEARSISDENARKEAAYRIMSLFKDGAQTSEALRTALMASATNPESTFSTPPASIISSPGN